MGWRRLGGMELLWVVWVADTALRWRVGRGGTESCVLREGGEGEGDLRFGRACGEMREFEAWRARACTEGAGRRAPHAERAVILPAVQSLRLAGSEGWWGEGRVRSLACPGLYGEGW
jgi:hypothetical protein